MSHWKNTEVLLWLRGSKKKMFSFLNKRFHCPDFFQIATSDVPSARPRPLFSSCWKWPETGLWGQSPAAPPVWWNIRGQIKTRLSSTSFQPLSVSGVCTCVSPVVLSWWRRTDAALLHRRRIRMPGYLSHLWRWRRSCLPRARAQSPDEQRGGFLVGSQSR